MRKLPLGLVAAAFFAVCGTAAAGGARVPSLAQPAVSPDGREIAFVSGGRIWTVSAAGGDARVLVSDGATDERPLWSPSGSRLAYISGRTGNGDIYILSLNGGEVRRLTYDDGYDQLDGWSRDGWVYFSNSSKNVFGERDIYRVRASGGTPLPVLHQTYVTQFFGAPSPNGRELAFNARGFALAQWWRKGHSHLDEIWIRHGPGDAATYTRVTGGSAKETWPMWSPDGSRIYFVSDRSGAQNLWVRVLGAGARRLTDFTSGRVVWPAIAANGSAIVFERNFAIWRYDTARGTVARVPVTLQGNVWEPNLTHVSATRGFSTYHVSPDGKKVAFIVHGHAFGAGVNGEPALEVTRPGEYARDIVWAPDSTSVAYTAGQGHEVRLFTYDFATDARRELTSVPSDMTGIVYAPGGGAIAFEENRRYVRTISLSTRAVRTLATAQLPWTPEDLDVPVAWSPDGRWIGFIAADSRLFTNVHVVPASGSAPERPASFLANSFSDDVVWTKDGRAILFSTAQRTEQGQVARIDLLPRTPKFKEDLFKRLFTPRGADLQQPPASPRPEIKTQRVTATPRPSLPVRIDWRGLRDRSAFLSTGLSVDAVSLSPDGKTLLLTASDANEQNLYVYALEGAANRVATQVTASAGGKNLAQWAPDGKSVYYLSDQGQIVRVSLVRKTETPMQVVAEYDSDWDRDKNEAFLEAWSAIRDYYADPHTNGVDWNAVRAKYAPQIAGAQRPDEMRRLLSLMIGELNSSHTGVGSPVPFRRMTGHLGLEFDRSIYEREGVLRVTHVVANSPANVDGHIRVGDELLAVNGHRLGAGVNLDEWLNDTAGKKTMVEVRQHGRIRTLALQPVLYDDASEARYREWVAQNRAYVDRASGGRLGYVHMPDMTQQSLDQFYKDLDAIEFSKQGVIIDIRSNHGGFVNAYAIDVLARRAYLRMQPRGMDVADARNQLGQRALEKPSVLMVNEETLSDGEDFTQAYRYLHVGKVVGVPTAGWIIYTSAIRLVDGTVFRLPFIKITTESGAPMELHPRPVDVYVQRALDSPNDAQLETAVRVLLPLHS